MGAAACPESTDGALGLVHPCPVSFTVLGGFAGLGVDPLLDRWWRDDSQAAQSPALGVGAPEAPTSGRGALLKPLDGGPMARVC